MLTEKDYCDYETCVALKELGFDSLVDWYFKEDKSIASSLARYRNTYIPRISIYEAQKWLREEKRIEVVVLGGREIGGPYYADIYTERGYAGYVHKPCEKYEEALSEGIKAAVKILKDESV